MSTVKTLAYNLAEFLVLLLEPITTNTCTARNSFEFAKEIACQDPGIFMASLDVESFFTNVPLAETINVCSYSLFSNDDISTVSFPKNIKLV